MNDKYLALLLQLIKESGSVNQLLKSGLTYAQIADLIISAKNDGYLIEEETTLILAPKGLEKLKLLIKNNKQGPANMWISYEEGARLDESEKLSIFDIYVPRLKKLKL